MEYYKVNTRTGSKTKVYFIQSNMFQKDIVKRLFPNSWETVCNGDFVNPQCLRFTVLPQAVDQIGSVVFVTRLFAEDVNRIESDDEFRGWKRIYKIQ